MVLNPIDLVVVPLTLVLGLKGAFNGLRKELFGFVGLVGGVFVASRAAEPLARWVEGHLFHLGNPAILRLLAFVLVLILLWSGATLLERLLAQRDAPERFPSPLSRFLGFLIATAKYFLVFAMILSALYRTPPIRHSLQRHTQGSLLFPALISAGSALIHLAPVGHPTPPTPHGKK
jgi:membrane protein required for colicin V production